jgi:NitT/TauT family transport system permease protein
MVESRRFGVADALLPVSALGVGVLGWLALTGILSVPSFLLPSPVAVASRLTGAPGLFLRNAWFTLEKVLYGGAIGVAVGFVLALLVAYLPWFRRAIYPYLVTVRVLPKIAVAPLLLIYLGTGMATAVVFVALIAFFPLVLSTSAGLDRLPEAHLDLLRSVDASAFAEFRVRLRYALPDVFAGLKQSVTLATVGAVIAEWVIADSGLGFLILLASENVQTDLMLAALVVLVAEGLALYGAVVAVQRLVAVREVQPTDASGRL